MPKFRKKPVVVEAVKLEPTYKSVLEVYRFIHGEESVGLKTSIDHEKFDDLADSYIKHGLPITTLEGTMKAMPGDWIIKGVKGEYYPCKNDIFEATYEPAD